MANRRRRQAVARHQRCCRVAAGGEGQRRHQSEHETSCSSGLHGGLRTTPVKWSPMYVALTRAVPPTLADCELTHLAREPIDLDRAIAQHSDYEALLRELGARVERVAPAPEHPDSVFIEDTA